MGRSEKLRVAGPSLASLERLRAKSAKARSAVMPPQDNALAAEMVTSASLWNLAAKLPVRDQPDSDVKCVAYAFSAAMDLSALAQTGIDPDLHERFAIDDCWKQMKRKPEIPAGMRAAKAGITDETCWPHRAEKGCPEVTTQRFRADVEMPVVARTRNIVPTLCDLIDAKVPLVIGIPLFSTFTSFKGTALYRVRKGARNIGIAHALVMVGYEEDAEGAGGCWVALNSWGENWGDRGFVRIGWNDIDLRPEATVYTVSNIRKI